jgi:hypothetical protein
VIKYLKGIVHYGMRYVRDGEFLLHGFVDSDSAVDASTPNSTFRYCFNLVLGMISWFNKKQVALILYKT